MLQEKYEGFELLLNTKMLENWAEGEAALRLAEASLDAAPEPLFRVEQDGRFSFVNVSACRSLGYSREELLSLTLSDINVDIPLAKLTPLWADLREAGTVDAEGRHRRKDGNSFPVALRIRHLELEGAELATISARDISAEKEVEQNLAQSEARSRAARRHAGVGFVEWAPGHGGLIWDDDTYRIFGYEPGSNDPTFDLVLEHIVPEDRKAFEEAERRVFEDFDSGYEVEYTIICARGVRHQIREEITVTRDFEASVIYATGFVIDVTKTKQAELDLRESEARLIEAQRMAQMGEWYLDLALGRLTYSDQVYELLGVTREEFQASPKCFEEFVHPEDREKFRRDIREREAVPEILSYDHRIVRPDGQIRYVEQRNEPILDEDGKVIARRGTIQDITEFKKITLALRERETELAQAQAITNVGSWHHSMSTDELSYSDEMFRILGLEKADFTVSTESFLAAVHPDDRDNVDVAAQRDPVRRGDLHFEHRIVRPDGAIRFVDHHSRPVFYSLGTVVARRGTMQDITERKEMEIALGLAQYSLDSAHDAIMRCGVDGSILYANPAACLALGYSEEELLGLSVPMITDLSPEELQDQ